MGRGQRQRVAHEGAGEVGDACFGVGVVAVPPLAAVERIEPQAVARDGRERQAAADDLAVGGDVGAHAVELLRATGGHAEARDHLVEDQRSAALGGDFAQLLHEGRGLQGRVLVLDRLDHDGRQFVSALAQHLQRLGAVVVKHQDVFDRVGQDAWRGRQRTQLLGAAHDDLVEDAVVAVVEDGDLLAARHSARDAHGAHHGFRAGVAESHALHASELGDQLRDIRCQRVLRADLDALVQLVDHGLGDVFALVAQEVGAETREQVDVLVAINVPDARAFGPVCHDGVDQVFPLRVEARDHARVGHHLAVFLTEGLGAAGAGVVLADEIVDPLLLCRRVFVLGCQHDAGRGAEWLLDEGVLARLRVGGGGAWRGLRWGGWC